MDIRQNPILNPEPLRHQEEYFGINEVRLASRNSGMPLEFLKQEVTPVGAHYLLNHFDIPLIDSSSADRWSVDVVDTNNNATEISLNRILASPSKTLRVTLECAGNGRANMSPRWPTQPWLEEAVSTADWTGTPLSMLLRDIGVPDNCVEIAFSGVDKGVASGEIHLYERSLPVDAALSGDALLVWAMNGQPLLPQHGYPLRLIVPGWYGMASVKWLNKITLLSEPFNGHQQRTYRMKDAKGKVLENVTTIFPRALMAPPGIPEWATSRRLLDAGRVRLEGRAWSHGIPIDRVEVGVNGTWLDAAVTRSASNWSWSYWQLDWDATPGQHFLSCRATDSEGRSQSDSPTWNYAGFCNNAPQQLEVWCT